jgi:uncharacterized protein (TIGR02594 family)
MAITISQIQQALKDKGLDPGPIDGIRGGKTIRAVMAFQAAHHLEVDGIVGPITAGLLLGGAQPLGLASRLPWYAEAQRLIGIQEDTSRASNPLIIGWAEALDLDYHDDETAWCGLFVAHCIASQLQLEPLPAKPLGAQSWAKFGREVTPMPGAVMVFWREAATSWKGHVGFYVSETPTAYLLLGGNQGDQVKVQAAPKARFITARWPVTGPAPSGAPILADARGATGGKEA